ncbi:MarR family transcriptional regulator [Candidatus Woesearchaeota archaeon]|nr:MarR family transcriptional regulator [Candidatus Woesearchaeota archaeon]
MQEDELLRTLQGLHTVETVAEALNLGSQSALNLLSRLKKEGYVTVSGGGKQKRLYKITITIQRPRSQGMFDILNKYSPMKLMPWFDHQVHGPYGAEEALIDAIETRSFRAILASLRLFNHITDWPKLYRLAKEKDCWQKVGALYDVARMFFRVRKMPNRYAKIGKFNRWVTFTRLRKKNFLPIASKWKVYLPFNPKDVEEIRC